MSIRRVLTHVLIPIALALAGGWAGYLLIQWLLGMTAAGMIAADVPWAILAGFALISCLAMTVFVPVLQRWRPGRALGLTLSVIIGLSGVVAAAGVAVAAAVVVCPDLCAPKDTWAMLPSLLVAGLCAGMGPLFHVLAREPRDLGGFPDTRVQVFWALTVIGWVLGFLFAVTWWVEVWLFPS